VRASLILVLGGAGDMGSGVVEEICRVGIPVSIGDVKMEEAGRIAAGLQEFGKVDVVRLDVNARDELVRKAREYDVVVNAVGPFYRYGHAIASALIDAGVNFVDICDDYDATDDILGLSNNAREIGIIGVTGLGWTPGISNILAKKAYEEVGGDVDAVDIWWFGSAADSRGLAVVMHLFYALTGDVPMYLRGRLTRVKAGSSPGYSNFPIVGNLKLYYTGHPEPVTIPRSMHVSERVTVRGGLIPQWQNKLVKLFIKIGLTSTKENTERLARFIHRIEDVFRSGGRPVSGVRVDVTKGESRVSYCTVGRMKKLTSIPASIGAVMLLNREIKGAGVYPPEEIIEPTPFLAKLGEKGIEITKY